MTRVFLDTNIVLDFLLAREPWSSQATPLWEAIAAQRIQAVISGSTPLIVFYVARKTVTPAQLKTILRDLLSLLEVAPVDQIALQAGLDLPMDDYEDAVSAACARSCGAEIIITRDLKDFKRGPLPALNPADFVSLNLANAHEEK